jgi:glycosyltransferase involved in cell wall biosynthesis
LIHLDTLHDDLKNNLKVIVTGHNTESWAEKCINSIKNQTYKNFVCAVVDDCSIDSSLEKIKNTVNNDKRFHIFKSTSRKYALSHIADCIKFLCKDDNDIIVQIDGDDWLYDENVFQKLIDVHTKKNIWLTYGQFVKYPSMEKGFCQRYFEEVIKNKLYRENIWISSQLRTFKYFLWKNIKDEDLRDEQGSYYKIVWDLAMMFPMMEMCESENIHVFVNEILYVYNMNNPINDFKLHIDEIAIIEKKLRLKTKYKTLKRD